jgi:NodT family efflux transporter outer membrane factor (OMF) lipoprotein
MARSHALLAAAACAAALSGCLAPRYVVPQVAAALPATYKEVGPWTPAAPADAAPRGDWWTVFGDDRLNALEGQLTAANPDLAQALARYDLARADFRLARADMVPQIGLGAQTGSESLSADRLAGLGVGETGDENDLGGLFSYELDLWGRVRDEVAAGRAEAQASAADVASTRLCLEAQLADAYLSLRGLDAQARVLDQTVASYARALGLTRELFTGGAVSGIDVGEAENQLKTAQAAESDVLASRALLEHAVASLVGVPASTFSLPVAAELPPLPETPISAPSVLLQRRPDIAAAERRAYEANRRIGVARAAYYPTVSLTGSAGFETSSWSQSLLSASSSYWLVGPQLAMVLLDGGRRAAGVAAARAQFDQVSGAYRGTVLAAFQQVEDNLALLNHLAVETQQEQGALEAARRTLDLSMSQYRDGAVTYLDVVTAQTSTLQAERAVLQLQTRRLQASVDLVRALGGGWDARELDGAERASAPKRAS